MLLKSRAWLALFMLFAAVALAQAPRQGDSVEVKIGDKIELAEFVSAAGNGALIRVKLADGTMKLLPSTHVRKPKGAAAAPKPAQAPAAPAPAETADAGLRGQREWTDSTGKFKIPAEFVALDGQNVQLKRADGKIVTLPLDKLGIADREIAKSLAAPPKNADNPFEANVTELSAGSGFGAPLAGAGQSAGPVSVDFKSAPALLLNAPDAWKFTAEAPPAAPAIPNRAFSLPAPAIGGGENFFEQAERIFHVSGVNQIWSVLRNKPPGKPASTRIERSEIATGKSLRSLRLEAAVNIVEVHPGGKFALGLDDSDFSTRNQRADLYQISGDELTLVKSFSPYVSPGAKASTFDAQVTTAHFLDEQHLLTVSNKNVLVVWELGSLRPIYRIDQDSQAHKLALSPSRKHLLVGEKSNVLLLESLTGAVVGQLAPQAAASSVGGGLFWHPENKEAALLAGGQLLRWELATGKFLAAHDGIVSSGKSLAWLTGNLVLVDSQSIYDLERRLPICLLAGGKDTLMIGGKLCCLMEQHLGGSKQFGVLPLTLPTPEMIARVNQTKEEELLAVKPGERIRLELNLPFDGAEIDKIRAAFERQITANGWVVADDGELVLSAEVMPGETREIAYRTFRFFETTRVSVTYQIGKMSLKRGEEQVWGAQVMWGPPYSISLKEGETIEQATEVKPSPAFFSGATIPKRLLKLPGGRHLMTGIITPTGLQVR